MIYGKKSYLYEDYEMANNDIKIGDIFVESFNPRYAGDFPGTFFVVVDVIDSNKIRVLEVSSEANGVIYSNRINYTGTRLKYVKYKPNIDEVATYRYYRGRSEDLIENEAEFIDVYLNDDPDLQITDEKGNAPKSVFPIIGEIKGIWKLEDDVVYVDSNINEIVRNFTVDELEGDDTYNFDPDANEVLEGDVYVAHLDADFNEIPYAFLVVDHVEMDGRVFLHQVNMEVQKGPGGRSYRTYYGYPGKKTIKDDIILMLADNIYDKHLYKNDKYPILNGKKVTSVERWGGDHPVAWDEDTTG